MFEIEFKFLANFI